MSDASRWAARYQFVDELWRDVPRLVVDPAMERALSQGLPDQESLAELVQELLGADGADPGVWFGMEQGRRTAEYARRFSGVVFAPVSDLPELASDEDWRVALVDLTGLLSERKGEDADRFEARLGPALSATLETVGDRLDEGRTLVLSVPAQESAGARGADLDTFLEYVDASFDDARIYALAATPMVSVYEVGDEDDEGDGGDRDPDEFATPSPGDGTPLEALEAEDDAEAAYDADLDEAERSWADGPGPRSKVLTEPDELAIAIDNRLGAELPVFHSYVAVIGSPRWRPEAVTHVELPPGVSVAPTSTRELPGGEADASGLRAQLAQAQRQAELLALEKQRLFEELEDARDRLDAIDDGEAFSIATDTGGARLDAALASAQELRWRVRELEGKHAELLARPVSELEAENATLRQELAELRAGLEEREAEAEDDAGAQAGRQRDAGAASRTSGSGLGEDPSRPELQPEGETTGRVWVLELVSRVDRLLRRVERGGLSTLELHRGLKKLRARIVTRR